MGPIKVHIYLYSPVTNKYVRTEEPNGLLKGVLTYNVNIAFDLNGVNKNNLTKVSQSQHCTLAHHRPR